MAKYRIKIEPIDPAIEELTADERLGIECEGFVLITDHGDKAGEVVHNMSILDIAGSMAGDSALLHAACIARGMAEGEQFTGKLKAQGMLSRIFGANKEEE